MKTSDILTADLSDSAIAVPPLARNDDLSINKVENRKLIAHIEQGGISTLMYGGNANFYNLPLSEYAETLDFLADAVDDETWLIPSAGPDYGRLIDQAPILRDFDFPTVMALPQASAATSEGAATALRRFTEKLGRPIILYIKQDGYIAPPTVGRLIEDGTACGIKYAVVRDNPTEDAYLRQLLEHVDAAYIASGIGERPALAHVRDFGLRAFTTGCGVIAPSASMAMLHALHAEDFARAEEIRTAFMPLEDLRDGINPIRVLHDAVTLSGIADMGPILPLLHNLEPEHRAEVQKAAATLLRYNNVLLKEWVNA